MKGNFSQNIYLKHFKNRYYLEKDNIVMDKICPLCKKHVLKDNICECGFVLNKSEIFFNNAFKFLFSFILITGLLSVILYSPIKNISFNSFNELKKENFNFKSLSPVNIQIINKLKKKGFSDYIQNIYIKPKNQNKLVIIIKPSLWHVLSKDEKKELFLEVKEEWLKIYKKENPDSLKKAEVYFANS